MRAIDLRIIFDDEEQQIVVGCHECEHHGTAAIKDVEKVVALVATFSTQHLQTCSKDLK